MFCLCNIVYSSLICLFVPFLWWANNTSLIDTKTKSTYERLFEKDTIVKNGHLPLGTVALFARKLCSRLAKQLKRA